MYWCFRVLLHFSLHAIPKWTSEGKMAQNPVNFVIDLRIKKPQIYFCNGLSKEFQ